MKSFARLKTKVNWVLSCELQSVPGYLETRQNMTNISEIWSNMTTKPEKQNMHLYDESYSYFYSNLFLTNFAIQLP